MTRAGEVLRELDEIAVWVMERGDEVPCPAFDHRRNFQASRQVKSIEFIERVRLVANMHQAKRAVRIFRGIEFDELMVIDFDEDFCRLAALGERECLFKAEDPKESALPLQVGDTKRHMGNSIDLRSLCLGGRRARKK